MLHVYLYICFFPASYCYLFQTKGHHRKDVSEQIKNGASSSDVKPGGATNSDHQHLPTDVGSCNSEGPRAAASCKNCQNDACTSSPKNVDTSSSSSLFTPVTLFVSSRTALSDCVSELRGDHAARRLMLTGLHTCGNLSADVLRLFAATASAQLVCQIGCCYNLLSERFLRFPAAAPERGNYYFTTTTTTTTTTYFWLLFNCITDYFMLGGSVAEWL